MENNNQRMLQLIESHATDMEEMRISKEKLSQNLRRAIDSMRILLDDNKNIQLKNTILEAEKKGLEDVIYYQNNKKYNENNIFSKLYQQTTDNYSQTEETN